MKDNYENAGFFGKREREENGSAPNIAQEAFSVIQDYLEQSQEHFPQIKSFYISLLADVRKLDIEWNKLTLLNADQQKYILELTLLRKWGKLCPDIDGFCVSIRQWKKLADNAIAVVNFHAVKKANSNYDPAGFIKEDAITMEQMLFTMESQKEFIKGEMTRLKNLYQNGPAEIRQSIHRLLEQSPKLDAWASPFFNDDPEPLSKAVTRIKPKL